MVMVWLISLLKIITHHQVSPVDGSGKALDVDSDGIPDYQDIDPFTAPVFLLIRLVVN